MFKQAKRSSFLFHQLSSKKIHTTKGNIVSLILVLFKESKELSDQYKLNDKRIQVQKSENPSLDKEQALNQRLKDEEHNTSKKWSENSKLKDIVQEVYQKIGVSKEIIAKLQQILEDNALFTLEHWKKLA